MKLKFQIVRPEGWMSVDNAVANDLTLSTLATNVYIVEWSEGRGEIEYNDRPALRESVVDVIPYAPCFQEFLTKLAAASPPLTLAQAKKVQNDLILTIYDSKRQLPYAYAIGGTQYTWDATDGATAAMALQMLPKLFNSIGFVDTFTNDMANQINAFLNVLNYQVLTTNANSLSVRLQKLAISVPNPDAPGAPTNFDAASPGLIGNLPLLSFVSYPVGYALSATVSWTPLNQTTPVNLTMAQMTSLMSGIAARQQSLNGVRQSKTNAVNALTKIADVIAYNVGAGWP
jgi:hypothetical protein